METKYVVLNEECWDFTTCGDRKGVEEAIACYLDDGTEEEDIVVYEVARVVPFTAIPDGEHSRAILGV